MNLEPHPLRAAVLGEVHARPYSAISAPRRVLHFAFMTDAAMAEEDRKALAAFCETRGRRGPEARAKYHKLELSNHSLRWEQHAEFTTYTWGFEPTDKQPFADATAPHIGLVNELPQPGPLLVCADLHYGEESAARDWRKHFDPASLTACRTLDGRALAATDFHAGADGFVRFLVLGRKLEPLEAGALVLQLLELETYRVLCLLGLPVAQRIQPGIRDAEQRLAAITGEMTETSGLDANRGFLERIMGVAGELEASASQAQFRFGATAAYYQIVKSRIADLKEDAIAGVQPISGFLERRIAPAIRTCHSVEERQEKLAEKLARTANLLRTRVDIELEQQNADLLKAMSDRAGLQLRLQSTVEGLSIAAISYYVAQLLFYLLGPLKLDDTQGGKWIKAAVVLAAVGAVAMTVRSIRRKHTDQ